MKRFLHVARLVLRKPRLEIVRAWYEPKRTVLELAFGLWLMAVSIALVCLAISYYQSQSDTQKAASAACLRTKQLAPPLLEFFASFNGTSHALPADTLAAYNLTVPKECP